MDRFTTGRSLIVVGALSSIFISILVDGVIYADAHMQNPLWLPHAKLHCAMSFHASIALGLGSLMVLGVRWHRLERADLAIAAFLGMAFWAGLLLARLWPGTSWSFAKDPAFVGMDGVAVLGVHIDPNAAVAVLFSLISWTGYALAARSLPARAPSPSS